MRKNIIAILGIVVVVLLNTLAFAEKHSEQQSTFNVTNANQSFQELHSQLKTHHDYKSIVFYVEKIQDLQTDAKKCVATSESHLKIIAELLKSTQVDAATQLQRADLKYLQGKQVYYTQQSSECRLLVYRSRETLINYKDVIQTLGTHQILLRSTPIWKFEESGWRKSIDNIHVDTMLKLSGLGVISKNQWYSVLIFIFLAAFLGSYVRNVLKRAIVIFEKADSLWRGLLVAVADFVVPSAILGVFSVFLNIIYQEVMPAPTLELLSHAALFLLLSIVSARYLFFPSMTCPGLFALPPEQGRRFYWRVIFLAWIIFLGYATAILLRDQDLSLQMIEWMRTIYLSVVSGIAAWIFFLWYRSPYLNRFHHGFFAFFSTTFILGLVALVVLEWVGYHSLAMFVVRGLSFTMGYTILVIALWRIVDALYQWIDNTHYSSARHVHRWLGVKPNKKMHELVLLKLAAHFSVLCLYFILLLYSWSIASIFVDAIIDGLISGFKFFGITIVPLRLTLACVVFAVIFLMGRLFAATLSNKQEFKGEEYTQIAISTIAIYVFFGIAFLFAMLVSGVDFTGLAIIAGALSVGVGLGLQNIVNNFVSGLILLLEKPIKPGDRIVIGKTEGFVRKIRIRSTQIATLSKEDVIVPNADFMTQQVVNYMFRDRYSRVSCQVGVAYGSDVHLVKKILLEVASKHTEVVQEAPNSPVVLFSRFGDSSLIFDLLCVIYDVNKKNFVMSDLNFAIDAAFRENKIDIPFPQREIHIKGDDHVPPVLS